MNIFYNPGQERLRAGWRLILQFILLLVFLSVFFFLFGLILPEIDYLKKILGSLAGFTLSVWIAAKFFDKRSFKSLGLDIGRRWLYDFFVGMGIAAIAMAVIFLVEFSVEWITFTGYGWERGWQTPYPLPLLGYIGGMILVGFYEELFSRGYHITNMIEGFTGRRVSVQQAALQAVLISSSIFGILHAGNPNASLISTINIIIAGAVLAVPYLVTGSLALSIGLHAAWNFFQGGVFGFPVSGMPERSSLLQVRETGPDVFTGGNFGPEAGLMGILGLLLILVIFYFYARKEGYSLQLNNNFKNKTITTSVISEGEQSR